MGIQIQYEKKSTSLLGHSINEIWNHQQDIYQRSGISTTLRNLPSYLFFENFENREKRKDFPSKNHGQSYFVPLDFISFSSRPYVFSTKFISKKKFEKSWSVVPSVEKLSSLPSFISNSKKTGSISSFSQTLQKQKNKQIRLIPMVPYFHNSFINNDKSIKSLNFNQSQNVILPKIKKIHSGFPHYKATFLGIIDGVPKKIKTSSIISQFLLFNTLKISIYKSFLSKIFTHWAPIIYQLNSSNLFFRSFSDCPLSRSSMIKPESEFKKNDFSEKKNQSFLFPSYFSEENYDQSLFLFKKLKKPDYGFYFKKLVPKIKMMKKQETSFKNFLKRRSEFQSNKQINETLFVLFYSSPPKNKEQKKQIKMPGFTFLNYLFDSPYFIYNNYTPSYIARQYVKPESSNLKVNSCFFDINKRLMADRFTTNASLRREEKRKASFSKFNSNILQRRTMEKKDFLFLPPASSIRENHRKSLLLPKERTWNDSFFITRTSFPQILSPFLLNRQDEKTIISGYVFPNDLKNKHEKSFKNNQPISPYLMPSRLNFLTSFVSNSSNCNILTTNPKQNLTASDYDLLLRSPAWSHNRARRQNKTKNHNSKVDLKNFKKSIFFPFYKISKQKSLNLFVHEKLKWNMNQSRNQLINILNTNNFRDILFERFFNSKFYDIGLMGRKRLNKKLRLNIPLYCTALTPLDFLALFYKLFFLLNPKTPVDLTYEKTINEEKFFYSNFSGDTLKNLNNALDSNKSFSTKFDSIPLVSPLNNTWEKKHLKTNFESHPNELTKNFPGLVTNFTPVSTLEQNLTKERMMLKKSLLGESTQRSSLDHLNQRHIRTSGEFLFLQFWRSVLRFYQILTQLSNRSNFLGPRPYVNHHLLGISPKLKSESSNTKLETIRPENFLIYGHGLSNLIPQSIEKRKYPTGKLTDIQTPIKFMGWNFTTKQTINHNFSSNQIIFNEATKYKEILIHDKQNSFKHFWIINQIKKNHLNYLLSQTQKSIQPNLFGKKKRSTLLLSDLSLSKNQGKTFEWAKRPNMDFSQKVFVPLHLSFVFHPFSKKENQWKKDFLFLPPASSIRENHRKSLLLPKDSSKNPYPGKTILRRQYEKTMEKKDFLFLPPASSIRENHRKSLLLPKERTWNDSFLFISRSVFLKKQKTKLNLNDTTNNFNGLLKKKRPSNQSEILNSNDLNSIIPFSMTFRNYSFMKTSRFNENTNAKKIWRNTGNKMHPFYRKFPLNPIFYSLKVHFVNPILMPNINQMLQNFYIKIAFLPNFSLNQWKKKANDLIQSEPKIYVKYNQTHFFFKNLYQKTGIDDKKFSDFISVKDKNTKITNQASEFENYLLYLNKKSDYGLYKYLKTNSPFLLRSYSSDGQGLKKNSEKPNVKLKSKNRSKFSTKHQNKWISPYFFGRYKVIITHPFLKISKKVYDSFSYKIFVLRNWIGILLPTSLNGIIKQNRVFLHSKEKLFRHALYNSLDPFQDSQMPTQELKIPAKKEREFQKIRMTAYKTSFGKKSEYSRIPLKGSLKFAQKDTKKSYLVVPPSYQFSSCSSFVIPFHHKSQNLAVHKSMNDENSMTQTILKKLLFEFIELRIFDAKDRMRNIEIKLFNSIFKEFFNLDPLSQDLDETNGLSEIIHKRRISALGTGGVTSKNAPLSIRSIHPSFYGRLCPIDSPEGDRVGLINSLTNYARITSIGYIATPFYKTRLPNLSFTSLNHSDSRKTNYLTNTSKKIQSEFFTQHSSSLQMRICPPIAFWNHSLLSISSFSSVQLLPLEKSINRFSKMDRVLNRNFYKDFLLMNGDTPDIFYQNQMTTKAKNYFQKINLRQASNRKRIISKPLKLSSKMFRNDLPKFYDTHYMMPPITNREIMNILFFDTFSFQPRRNGYYKKQKPIKDNTSISHTHFFSDFFSSNIEKNHFVKKDIKNASQNKRKRLYQNMNYKDSLWTLQNDFTRNTINKNFRPRPSKEKLLPMVLAPKKWEHKSVSKEYTKKWSKHSTYPLKTHSYVPFYRSTPKYEIVQNHAIEIKASKFLICYFDFISFQGYAPINVFQFFSPGVGLIPFLEHDDGTRALMGANMQRQAIPLISAERPIVGTGLEKAIATSFIISSPSSSFLYYISGKQSKQIILQNKKNHNSNHISSFLQSNGYPLHSFEYLSKQKKTKRIEPLVTDIKKIVNKTQKKNYFLKNELENSSKIQEFNTSKSMALVLKKRKKTDSLAKLNEFSKLHHSMICFKDQSIQLFQSNKTTELNFSKNQNFKNFLSVPPSLSIRKNHGEKRKNVERFFSFYQSYRLPKNIKTILNTHWLPYRKSYKATCINKISTCIENSWLQKGDLLVNGGSSINGELALGRNLFSIYMPWEGYNFEDAILISDRVAQIYSTIYVEEFSIKIHPNELVSNIVESKTCVNQGHILVSKKRKVENNFLINRLLLGMEQLKKN
nr:hypothetical protein [Trentepohlia sp. YN1242]